MRPHGRRKYLLQKVKPDYQNPIVALFRHFPIIYSIIFCLSNRIDTLLQNISSYQSSMDLRVLLLLSVLGLSRYCDARELMTTVTETEIISGHQQSGREVEAAEVGRNEKVCTLCEEYTAEALNYLANNKTQTEIIEILHKSCSKLFTFKQECITFVDSYVPVFFLEISSIQPGDFCRTVNLCEQVVSVFQHFSKDGCDLCHRAVMEALSKLKDPDTQLQIIEILLKACDAAESYANKCKRLVFEYGPIILVNAEHFLETNDICAILHACTATTGAKQSLPRVETSMHSAS